jgi:hypothetical protein
MPSAGRQLAFELENFTLPEMFQLHALSKTIQLHISAALSLTSLQTTSTDCWGSLKLQIEAKHISNVWRLRNSE